MDEELLTQCLQTAHDAGSPPNQPFSFLNHGYVPYPWQWQYHAAAREADTTEGPTAIGVGGARGPGKSHSIFAQITLDDCQRQPGLKALFLRQTGKAARESFEDLILKVLSGQIAYEYVRESIRFPNGSKVLLGGFHEEKDIDKYIGIEYDLIGIEEANQLTKRKVDMLLGSMRTSKSSWRPRLYVSFNPGGIGHAHVKETYVVPYQKHQQTVTRFIPATYRDNPSLNPEYVTYLQSLEGQLGKAWRDGNFDILEGQFFPEWRFEVHTVSWMNLMATWRKYITFDYGSTNPFAAYWIAIDYDGRLWCYREYYVAGRGARENAEAVMALSQQDPVNPETGNRYEAIVAPMDVFAKQGNDTTIAEVIEQAGLTPLVKSGGQTGGSRVAKAALMHDYLAHSEGHPPKLRLYAPMCPNAIQTIPALIHDQRNPEDVDGQNIDHCLHGETVVRTLKGNGKIKDLVGTKGYVRSLFGAYVPYTDVKRTRLHTETVRVTFSDNRSVVCTPDHLFLTDDGWVPAQSLDGCAVIDVRSSGMIQSGIWTCIFFLKRSKNFMAKSIISAINTFKEMAKDFTGRYGNTIMAIFPPVFTFITKIKTERIMISETLSSLNSGFTYASMPLTQHIKSREVNGLSSMLCPQQKNGIKAQQEKNGTRNMRKIHGKIRRIGTFPWLASAVESLSGQCSLIGQSIVRNVKSSKGVIVLSVQYCENADTYNLEAIGTHCFSVENGIIVHNSYDSISQFLLFLHHEKSPQPVAHQKPIERILTRLKQRQEQEDSDGVFTLPSSEGQFFV